MVPTIWLDVWKNIKSIWTATQARSLTIFSVTWQVILIILGTRRRYRKETIKNALFLWIMYLTADSVATAALAVIYKSQGDGNKRDQKNQLLYAIWAPFLILHLGAPDTITAYALEDNTFWLRQLIRFASQIVLAFTIIVRTWLSEGTRTTIAIPVFVAAIIKCSERGYVMFCASPSHLEDTWPSATPLPHDDSHPSRCSGDEDLVREGYFLFEMLKRLYAKASLQFEEWYSPWEKPNQSQSQSQGSNNNNNNGPFDYVEVQLRYLYDVFYTKATVIYTKTGIILRFITVTCLTSALLAFVLVVQRQVKDFSGSDIYITYLLFGGALFLELYGFVSLLISDWTMLWLTTKSDPEKKMYCLIKRVLRRFRNKLRRKRWSKSMAQNNLVSCCLKRSAFEKLIWFDNVFKPYFMFKQYWQRDWEEVDAGLKKRIYEQLRETANKHRGSDSDSNPENLKDLLSHRGDSVLIKQKKDHGFDVIKWSVEIEFAHSVLIWHVATDICYYSAPGNERDDENLETSKKLSNYMLYLLLMRPAMLPEWTDRIWHLRDTFREATRILQRKQFPDVTKGRDSAEHKEGCKVLVQMYQQSHQALEILKKEETGKSLLPYACRLALQIQQLRCHPKALWCMISEVWIEMLIYAACHCDWEEHAQQLRRGGELLTHVYVLMSDIGLNEQFDVPKRGPREQVQHEGWGWVTGVHNLP